MDNVSVASSSTFIAAKSYFSAPDQNYSISGINNGEAAVTGATSKLSQVTVNKSAASISFMDFINQ